MAKVITVLRSGGDFLPWHVQAMQRQVARWAPDAEFLCLSDLPVPVIRTMPLAYNWPGWWAKMEMFRPDIKGDLLCTDLDNVILGPLDDILAVDRVTFNTGKDDSAWTALMYLPEASRARVWDAFIQDPEEFMEWFNNSPPPFGDAGFITAILRAERTQRWETVLPGQVANLAYCQTPFGPRIPTPKPRVMLCYQPRRPWLLPMFKSLYEEDAR